jgi:hypothetical protein
LTRRIGPKSDPNFGRELPHSNVLVEHRGAPANYADPISQHKEVYREQSANRRHYFRIACHTPSSFLWDNAGRILACAIISIDARFLLHGFFAIGNYCRETGQNPVLVDESDICENIRARPSSSVRTQSESGASVGDFGEPS